MEPTNAFKIGGNDPEQEVAITRHEVTFNDLRKSSDSCHEPLHLILVLSGHAHPCLGRINDAAMSMAPAGRDVLTLEYKINFLRPATGAILTAIATVLRAGKAAIITRVDVADDQDRLCAVMQQTIVPTRANAASSMGA